MSRIVLDPVALPANPKPMDIKGSPITAAADKVATNTAEQATAVQTLGGKMAGGGTVEVKNIPPVPSSGNSNIGGVMAGMQELKAIAGEQGKYDALGNAPAMEVTTGGRRKRRSRKNKKNVHKRTRKHRGSSHRTIRIRHPRRRVHSARRQKTHKK